jgi:hypothetical protein
VGGVDVAVAVEQLVRARHPAGQRPAAIRVGSSCGVEQFRDAAKITGQAGAR